MSQTEDRQSFNSVAEQLRSDLNELLMGVVEEPVKQALAQIPTIMQRSDWNQEDKAAAIEQLQLAIVSPFLNAAVNVAQGSQMDLGRFLYYTGKAWEEIRSAVLANVAKEMLNRPEEPNQ